MADNQQQYNARLKAQARPRALKAIALRKRGYTWTNIGALLGITRQRAQALAKAHSKTNGGE